MLGLTNPAPVHELLPDGSGLLLLYTLLGLFGGAAAAVANAKTQAPPLWNVIRQSFTGAFAASVTGALCLKSSPDEVFLAVACCLGAGFIGPYAVWEWIASKRPDLPIPPPPPPPPPHTGDSK